MWIDFGCQKLDNYIVIGISFEEIV